MKTIEQRRALPWPYPTLFAHRGGGKLAPENTLAAMRCGMDHGYTAVEFDVKLSRDHVAILLHDPTLERTTSGQGKVANFDVADLEKLDAGAWHSSAFKGEPVPRFSAVAHLLHQTGTMANVEIKPCVGRETETGREVALLCAALWQDRVTKPLLSSFSTAALAAAQQAQPDLPRGLLVQSIDDTTWPLLDQLDCVSIHTDHRHLNADLVKQAHERGFRLLVYTVNDPERIALLLEWGIDGLFTDQLDVVAQRFPDFLRNGGRALPVASHEPIDWRGVVPPC